MQPSNHSKCPILYTTVYFPEYKKNNKELEVIGINCDCSSNWQIPYLRQLCFAYFEEAQYLPIHYLYFAALQHSIQ